MKYTKFEQWLLASGWYKGSCVYTDNLKILGIDKEKISEEEIFYLLSSEPRRTIYNILLLYRKIQKKLNQFYYSLLLRIK